MSSNEENSQVIKEVKQVILDALTTGLDAAADGRGGQRMFPKITIYAQSLFKEFKDHAGPLYSDYEQALQELVSSGMVVEERVNTIHYYRIHPDYALL